MNLLMENFSDVFVYNTFFYPKLFNHGFQAVCRWNKRVSFLSKRLLVFPVHLEERAHWCLAVADVANKQLTYFNSLKNENPSCLRILRSYLQELSGHCYSSAQDKTVPQQENSYDCGIFICMYTRCLVEKSTFNFTQCDTPAIRKHMALELLCKTLF